MHSQPQSFVFSSHSFVLLPGRFVLFLDLLDPLLQLLQLVICSCAEFFYDLEHSPQSTNDHQRSSFFNCTVEEDVNNETDNNDRSVEDVELGLEVPVGAD